jgi:hypothetical protein
MKKGFLKKVNKIQMGADTFNKNTYFFQIFKMTLLLGTALKKCWVYHPPAIQEG